MLFDLRGRGRRRTVQGIYLGLALLMGGGLVFFGVGGTGVGLFGNDNNNRGGGATDNGRPLRAAERAAQVHPRDPAALAELARQQFLAAGSGKNYDQNAHAYLPPGKEVLRRAQATWKRYLALNPKRPDANLARLMAQAFSPAGLNDTSAMVDAYSAVAQAEPTTGNYVVLAQAAYSAHQERQGYLAGLRAVELAPTAQRAAVKLQIKQAKDQAAKPATAPQGSSSAPSG